METVSISTPLVEKLWRCPRIIKRMIGVVLEVTAVAVAFFGALHIANVETPTLFSSSFIITLVLLALITVMCYRALGLYRAVLRYLTLEYIYTQTIATAVSTLVFGFGVYMLAGSVTPIMLFDYGMFLLLISTTPRLLVRGLAEKYKKYKPQKVAIYGAGAAARQLVQLLRLNPKYQVEFLLDIDPQLVGSRVSNTMVAHPANLAKLIKRHGVVRIIFAIPSLTEEARAEILNDLSQHNIEVSTIPHVEELIKGQLDVDDIRPVSIDDLLGRDKVEPNLALMAKNIMNKNVMVTGAGGSIGSELCRQIVKQRPTTLVLFEISEPSLYVILSELAAANINLETPINIVPILGNVQDQERVQQVLNHFSINTVYHAAAYKHVPLVEQNIIAGVKNNVFGTQSCVNAAINANVEKFVLISTDKAVRPTNVMGASKRMAELVLQANAKDLSHNTELCMVRFGNVLGSSGSVVPLFKKQIKNGGPITITHPEIIRYFMTIPEAAELVIQAGAMGGHGQVFVLDMGKPVKIKDLAIKMITLSGHKYIEPSANNTSNDNPSHQDGISINYVGLRPGEKLYEELLIGDNAQGTLHPKISTAAEISITQAELDAILQQLTTALTSNQFEQVRQVLEQAPTGFTPVSCVDDCFKTSQQITTNINKQNLH
ncbi:nucleoside-diphosphate sugar epimerase/dehydratase [Paraferrimonas sp. SM1919]|uniref:polysaccharide biosynthesis protein n=1 Tax=Paraferrimonas sp. SM1919 TaxID=2662263 RepID=UPI001969B263|nr:nucleoside-diphosphate sugar epimerase/dehydratase [Paraferrimonas sp. SM1919]